MAYTNIDDPSQYFDIVTYTGDGGSSKTITGLGFKADWLWIKNRGAAQDHILVNRKLNPPIIGAYDAVGGSTDTVINLSVAADTLNYVVFNEALIAGYDGQGLVTINLTLSNNAKIGSILPGLPGLDFRGFPTNCVLNLTINSGSAIYGCGGTGGNGGSWGNVAPSGSDGGDAIWLDKATTITNNGTVAGGGGGGGGGAGWAPTGMYGMGGAGGGGGAGFNGGAGGSATGSSVGVSAASAGSAGSTSGGGSGGSGSSKDGYTTHSGANGGGLGAAGGGSTGSHTSWAGQGSSGGAGGAGGKYTDGNTYATWSTEGTRTGSANSSVTNGVSLSAYWSSNQYLAARADTDRVLEINSSGFKVGADDTVNQSSQDFVAWSWKANDGAATFNDASATSVGTIDSVHEANTTAGFSVITYTGTGSAGTLAHGLGATPKFCIFKGLEDGERPWVPSELITGNANGGLLLDLHDAEYTGGTNNIDASAFSSTLISIKTSGNVNNSGKKYICYAFCEKQGYSKFGTYVGNGNADGTFIYTGFKPAWLLIKITNTGNSYDDWIMIDNKRETINPRGSKLYANENVAQTTDTNMIDILSNGFKQRTSNSNQNGDGSVMLYIAFAESPFVSSKGVPTTAI